MGICGNWYIGPLEFVREKISFLLEQDPKSAQGLFRTHLKLKELAVNRSSSPLNTLFPIQHNYFFV